MNRRGTSILGIGLIIAFGLVLITLIINTATQFIAFDRFSGDDATALSQLKYESYAAQFFVDRTTSILATELLKNESLPEYYSYLERKEIIRKEGDYFLVVDDNVSFNALYEIDSNFPTWVSDKFTIGFNEYAKQYMEKVRSLDLARDAAIEQASGIPSTENYNNIPLIKSNEYKLYWNGSNVYSIALQPSYTRYKGNIYYFWSNGNAYINTSTFLLNPMKSILTTKEITPSRTEDELGSRNFTVIYYDGIVPLKARVEKQN